jgi:predicted ATPase
VRYSSTVTVTAATTTVPTRGILTCAQEKLLKFEFDEGKWSFKLEEVAAKQCTDNVVPFMIGAHTHPYLSVPVLT